MGRKPCCEKVGLRRGPWTAEEDGKLVSYIANNGICCWRAIPKLAGLLRCGKSCRLRWTNYLRPDLKRGIFTEAEENLILELHATLGNRWSRIAAQLPGRTDNEIKNYWNTRLKKRLRSQGLDPNTHLPVDSTKGDDDDDGDDSSDGDVASGTNATVKKKAAGANDGEPPVKVRQPKGPKPQLKLCQSKEGQFVLTSTAPGSKSESESDSGSTVTAEGELIARKLSTAPSFPQAELWNCIKPTAPFPATSELLSDWDSYIMESATDVEYVAESDVDVFQEMELSESWTMDTDVSPPELTHVPELAIPGLNPAEHQQSQELQRLATLLELI